MIGNTDIESKSEPISMKPNQTINYFYNPKLNNQTIRYNNTIKITIRKNSTLYGSIAEGMVEWAKNF